MAYSKTVANAGKLAVRDPLPGCYCAINDLFYPQCSHWPVVIFSLFVNHHRLVTDKVLFCCAHIPFLCLEIGS